MLVVLLVWIDRVLSSMLGMLFIIDERVVESSLVFSVVVYMLCLVRWFRSCVRRLVRLVFFRL